MLDELQSLILPPSPPGEVDDRVLENNIHALGTLLPDDFVDYSRIYGSGRISVGVYAWDVYSAFQPGYPEVVKSFAGSFSEIRDALETSYLPLGLFPETEGLLPFAKCDNGVWFCWKTAGPPVEWNVFQIYTYDDNGYQRFDCGFSTFWVRLLTRQIDVEGYPQTWDPQTDLSFKATPAGWL